MSSSVATAGSPRSRRTGWRAWGLAGSLLVALPVLLAIWWTQRAPGTPEQTYDRLVRAVRERDAQALFDVLDQPTRWAWMSVVRFHREAYDIVLSSFPPGPDRERSLRLFEAGARAEAPADLFAATAGPGALTALATRLGDTPVFRPERETGCVRADTGSPGTALRLCAHAGRWGLSDLLDDARDRERRARADLDSTRDSALAFERAAQRSAP